MSDFQFPVGAYTRPAADAVELTFSTQTVDVIVSAVLPLPFVSVVVDGLREVTVAATLPLPSVSVVVESGVALVFSKSAPAGPDLLFGFDDGASIPRADIHVAATLPLPTLRATFAPLAEIQIDAQLPGPELAVVVRPVTRVDAAFALPGPVLSCEVEYRSNAQRPTVAATRSSHQVAQPTSTGAEHRQHDATASPHGWEAFWQRATGLTLGVEHRQAGTLKPLRVSTAAQHQDAAPMRDSKVFAHQVADRAVRRVLNTAFKNASRIQDDTLFRHQDGDRTKRAARRTYWQQASGLGVRQWSSFQPASRLPVAWWSAWQEGVPPPPGVSSKPSGPPGPTPCYTPSPHLLFSFPPFIGGNLVFQCGDYTPGPQPGETTIPIKRVYIVLNNVNLRRVSDNAVVPTLSMSLSLDASSWTWGFDATLPGAAQSLVEPTVAGPVELRATVNGTEFRVLAENLSRERAFGQISIKVSGRGRNAVLDAPYTPQQVFSNTHDRTSQQLMEDVLQFNGVPLGYTIDYGLEAWNVPAGVFNHQGTYISALAALAQAGGGYPIPDPSALAFKVRHRYPTKPWDPITPDFILPADVLVRESIAWREKPDYNRVYVSGQEQGVLGRVTRSGTAGDILAPMVTDPLITTAAAARQRGLAVLGDTGRQLELGISLPVMSETGIIQPGMYVQYVDGSVTRTGIVRSTQVSVGEIEVKQTLGVEVHA